MTPGGWFNFEASPTIAPEVPFFEGDPSFRAQHLTPRRRMVYFACLYICGITLSITGLALQYLALQSLVITFCLYVPGAISSLLSTGFLIKMQTTQFTEQRKLMFKPIRIVALTIFLVLTLVIIITPVTSIAPVWIPLLIFAYLALLVYSLSYIPSIYAGLLKLFKAT